MKMQKMDPKQAQQAIVLGVLCAGVFGYGIFTALSGAKPDKPAEKKSEEGKDDRAKGAETAAAGQPLAPLPPVFTADPFRSRGPAAKSLPQPGPSQAQPPTRSTEPQSKPKPDAKGGMPGPKTGLPPVTAGPPLDRPLFKVTGIMDLHEGPDVVLLELASSGSSMPQRRKTLLVGDEIENKYRVRRIRMDGIEVGRDKDRFRVRLGGTTPTPPAPPAQPVLPAVEKDPKASQRT